jgi:hypothetical protein
MVLRTEFVERSPTQRGQVNVGCEHYWHEIECRFCVAKGRVLNIAPLYELVPWKEAEKTWEELLDGKYEWSSIGKQLREKGLVPC